MIRTIVFLSLVATGCSSWPCENPTQPRADEFTCLPEDFEQTAEFWQAMVCARRVANNPDIAIHFINDEDWDLSPNQAGRYQHSLRNDAIFIRVWPTSNTYGLIWILNHELIHAAYGDSDHSGLEWAQVSGPDSLEERNFAQIRSCIDSY